MKHRFAYLMLFLSLAVAGCAGYFSVWGLSQLFAGASTAVVIVASFLEIAKVVTTTALHRYWDGISKALRLYLTIAVSVLMLITSAGIYGFLSNAYQKTANKLEIQQGQVGILDKKKELFQKDIDDNQKIINTKNKRIDQLTNLRSTQEARLDSARGSYAKDKVRGDIQNATDEIQKLSKEIDVLNSKNAGLSDSIGNYTIKTLDITSKSEVSGEVGPLKYISELTGYPMGKVVNALILLLIFVFDPLAIALVLMTNRIFEIEGEENPLEPKEKASEPVKNGLSDITPDTQAYDFEEAEEVDVPDEPTEENIEIPDEPIDVLDEPVIEAPVVKEPVIEHSKHREPVIPTGKVELKDIPEVKDRGYSVNVPEPKKNNAIQRIGTNKVVKDGDNDKVYFKR